MAASSPAIGGPHSRVRSPTDVSILMTRAPRSAYCSPQHGPEGIRLSNGIGWSPDNRVMYHCDSRRGYVYAYDYDIDSGTPTNRRIHLDLTSAGDHPDGCTVDAEGFLWLAEVGSSNVGRYAPDGRRVGGITLPTPRVTSVMFGGPRLDLLFITTMRYNLSPEESARQPLAGRLFVCEPGVKGLAEPMFAG